MIPRITPLLLLLGISCSAQEFRTLTPGTDRIFTDGNIIALRVLSSDSVGANTIHHLNKDLRAVPFGDPSGCSDSIPCWDNGGPDASYTLNGASWMGHSMIETPSGRNSFINVHGDSIHIETLAQLGDVWTIFSWDNGNKIIGSIINVVTQQVLGVDQIVKTIRLTTVDDLGNPIDHPLNGQGWKLSQFLGLTRVHSLFWFPDFPPLDSLPAYECNWAYPYEQWSDTIFTLTDVQPITYGDMYRLFPGDVFQVREHYNGINGTYVKYFQYDIVSRTYGGNASLSIEMNETVWNDGQNNPSMTLMTVDIVDTTAYFPNNILPGTSGLYLGKPRRAVYTGADQFCEHAITSDWYANVYNSDEGVDSCFDFYSQYDDHYYSFRFSKGVPIRWGHSSGFSGGDYRNIIYVNTTTCQFGTQVFVGINEVAEGARFTVWPNPTSGLVHLKVQSAQTVTVTDLTGRTVFSTRIKAHQSDLDLSHLPDGFYHLHMDGYAKGHAVVLMK